MCESGAAPACNSISEETKCARTGVTNHRSFAVVTEASRGLADKHVLIVEDEPLVAMEYANLLAEAGAHVVGSCGTVREALAVLKGSDERHPIDAAVVDFVLADRNSEPLQKALRQRRIPFVVVSAYPRPLVRTDAGDRILQKPVSAEDLCNELCDACRRAA